MLNGEYVVFLIHIIYNFQHQFVNREAEVLAIPTVGDTNIQVGDKVIVHHNVFRVWKNMRGVEQNSKSYYKDNTYFVFDDQIFLYIRFLV